MKHLPDLKGFTEAEIIAILDRGATIKSEPAAYHDSLDHRTLAMIFQKTSTRTRVSFEVAMTELGGHAIFIDWITSNFLLTGIEYETEYLSRNVHCIMARLLHNTDLQRIVGASQVPVINGCCEKFHPCQALTDIFTMREHFEGDLRDARLAFIGVQNNVSNSLAIICDKLGIHLTIATPDGDSAPESGISGDRDVDRLLASSPHIRRTSDPASAVQDAHFVYTDTWIDMEFFNDPAHGEENERKLARMMPYQVSPALLEGADCRIMHDMPVHEGFEIAAGLIRDPRSIIFEQAANRLHAQKGLLHWLLT